MFSCVAPEPVETISAITLFLAALFVPVIGLRLIAVYWLLRARADESRNPRGVDAELPIYTIRVPLYREAQMLAPLVRAVTRLDRPALGSKSTKRKKPGDRGAGLLYAKLTFGHRLAEGGQPGIARRCSS